MIVFMLMAAMMARLAESGHARESTTELDEVRKGTMVMLGGRAAAAGGRRRRDLPGGVVWGPATTVRGVRHLPRPAARRSLRPHREPARPAAADHRRPHEAGRDPGPQRREDRRHRPGDGRAHVSAGRRHGHAARPGGSDRPAAGVDAGAPARRQAARLPRARRTATRCGWRRRPTAASASCSSSSRASPSRRTASGPCRWRKGDEVRLLALPSPDFRPLLPAACGPAARRWPKVYDDIPSRTARITIDAKLQTQASQHPEGGGQARARRRRRSSSTPTPARCWRARSGRTSIRATRSSCGALTDPDFPVKDKKFTGVYGPWPDKTGLRGVFQGGSVAKVVTSLVAARAGLLGRRRSACAKTGPVFACKLRDGQGPFFTKPGLVQADPRPSGRPDARRRRVHPRAWP